MGRGQNPYIFGGGGIDPLAPVMPTRGHDQICLFSDLLVKMNDFGWGAKQGRSVDKVGGANFAKKISNIGLKMRIFGVFARFKVVNVLNRRRRRRFKKGP